MEGFLALVLHAHLPYVRDPQHEEFLEENWLFEAITETYIPLFLVLERLIEDGIDFRLTFSLTPTLASMLLDPLLQQRYLKKLDRTIELAEKEIARTESLPDFHPLALMYHHLLTDVRHAFVHRYRNDLVRAFRRFQELGKVEVIASAATHGYLPLLSVNESAVRAQIGVGVQHYQQVFGRKPKGFWLPECGYYPGVDRLLREQGIRYTILETHGVTRADHRPRYGVFAPVFCPSGLAVFGRDPDSSRQVWSSAVGYPGDFDYREFYRDIGHDLDLDLVRPYIHPDGIRIDTGLKYHRITGKGDRKEPYVPEWAERKAAAHAEHFLDERVKQIRELSASMDRPPLIVAPYDAELFGHWWFEGPRWLDYLIRKTALEQNTVRLVTLSEYLDQWPDNQIATPCLSSWGQDGFSEVWLNGENDWVYRHLHAAADAMEKLSAARTNATGLARRALNQAGRELLLAQASDWTFMIKSGSMEDYAIRRVKGHLLRMHRLCGQIESGAIDEAWLQTLEGQDNLFADIPTAAAFTSDANAAPLEALLPLPPPRRSPETPLRIVMACSEIVPFAKTGGLADMVASLAAALERLGHQVCLIMPAYRSVLQRGSALRETGMQLQVPVAGGREEGAVLTATLGRDIPVYFIRADRYFDRAAPYGTSEGDYPDNAQRFAYFARAVLEVLRHIGAPHVLHAHDWQAALSIAFLKAQPERYPGLSTVRTALTVHNMGYQGLFPSDQWRLLGLDSSLFTPRHFEFYGKINYLKAGLSFADAITTVSPTYAREIQTKEHGFGLEGVLQERAARLVGILNGVDYEAWNPQTDSFIAAPYGPNDLSGKRACKADLQSAFGLPVDPDVPLIGMVSRLAAQKGFDLLEQVLPDLLDRPVQLLLVGKGDQHYEDLFQTAAKRHAGNLSVRIAFDESLAHQVEAGADLFLMPSRYEPCGLNQLYSLKYGTIPIVRATGGLKDSVQEFDPAAKTGTGFLFEAYEPTALLDAVDRAVAAFHQPAQWQTLMQNAMAADYSWTHSARDYLSLYESLIATGHPETGTSMTRAYPGKT
ncbi:MAG: glycogen synthase GlgA [Acidobacteriia bacterium]|nr:glycogen synthase GlgA [Terriglobia bacterium]